MSVAHTDREAAAVAVAPRVTLADIEAAIAARLNFRGDQLFDHLAMLDQDYEVPRVIEPLQVLSICVLVMKNGFTVIGRSAPASPANFNAELGRKFAYEDCIRQLWPLMGFALRDRLAQEKVA